MGDITVIITVYLLEIWKIFINGNAVGRPDLKKSRFSQWDINGSSNYERNYIFMPIFGLLSGAYCLS